MSWKCEGCKEEWGEYFRFCGSCGAKKPAKKRKLAEELKRLDEEWKLRGEDRSENSTKQYYDVFSEGLVEFIGKVYREWNSGKSFEDYLREELL